MVKPGKLLPPDPRPWTADPQSRKARKEMEKQAGGFDWGQAIALGFIGATVVFGIDKSLRKCEERHEEEDRREERRRRRRDEREYFDRDWDEMEYRSVRDGRDLRKGVEAELWREESVRGERARERDYMRDAEQFDRDYGYGRRYEDEHRRSRSNPASRKGDPRW
ncbi:hypothetical protein CCHL11_00357 [Colletotrichum chlorophyti]|uniref:Uncharacterized protein n=1 Tax=Colletotrichum chlorophyti TaxID=708187 RepID=A0A1Q8RUA8_9PEZI|nr:hypothetical protein CCHL11_00357 [Colletotrichum chlorophyti]